MVYCTKCGKKNKDDAEFCSKCGAPLKGTKKDYKKTQAETSSSFEQQIEDFAEEVGKLGKNAGKKIEQAAKKIGEEAEGIGKRVEKKIDKTGKGFDRWYDHAFGISGPLISSFLGLIILRLAIEVMALAGDDVPVLGNLSAFLYAYLLLFFGLMLLSSYNSFFSRKYKQQFRWVSPVFSAVGLVILLWIVSKIFVILDNGLDVPVLATIASFIENNLIAIFVLVLLVGYLFLMFMISMEKDSKR